ncbi:MAG: dimethylarginine dimethylaminohydrolase family protein [Bacillus sp. (in: firmicutes)]
MIKAKKFFSVNCINEYNKLKDVIVCPPKFMQIKEAINETQKQYLLQNINQELAMKQHDQFVQTLQKNGIAVHMLTPDQKYNEQVFTRDIGFSIGNTLCIGKMQSSIREGEESVLKTWLDSQHISYYEITSGSIEGGDVIVAEKNIWIGLSGRTSQEAIDELKIKFPAYNILPLVLKKEILHLDCVFNIIAPHTAIIYKPAFSEDALASISKHYHIIEVDEEEQFSMGPNVLSIEPGKILSLPQNVRINEQLRQAGFHIIEIDFSELIKSGGSFRCCSLPIVRM